MSLSNSEQNTGAIISGLAVLLLSSYFIFSVFGLEGDSVLLAALLLTVAAIAGTYLFILRKLRRHEKRLEIDFLNIGIQRNILGLFMIFYGVPKLFGTFFDYQLFALDTKLMNVSDFELAWYYFGKNRWQEVFAGLMEFIPGVLLLHRRTYYFASLVLLPVTAQVFILNLFFRIGGITLPAATVLLACNVYIVYSQNKKIIQFFRSLDFSPGITLGKTAATFIKICKSVILIMAALVLFMNVKPALFKSAYQAKYEKLIGVYALEKMKKNGKDYTPLNDSTLYKDLYIEKQSRWNILRRSNERTDAFVMNINEKNDSINIYINKYGTGDGAAVLDTATALKGTYKAGKHWLVISGIQQKDTLQLTYKKQPIKPKEWFW